MKETKFIEQNKEKWAKFERMSKGDKKVNPNESAELFTEITEDLSYARTFYKRRSVRVYLNQLSQSVFKNLYKKRGNTWKKFLDFWKTDLPIELYKSRVNLLVAFLSFSLWIFIGAISQHFDPDFVRFILGDYYVDQTLERIENGDPMGVYGTQEQMSMFLAITLNNIRVAFFTFVMGFLATIGTHYFLLVNGTMLGAFQYWFYQKGLLLTSFLAVWIHGAFEISAIVIAAAAGITMGKGLLFPGTFSRMQAFQLAGKRGAKIMASLIPVFIMAGFLEGFVTRNYKMFPDIAKWGIILISFGLIIFYYIIYPILVARNNPDKLKNEPSPRFTDNKLDPLHKIRTSSESFTQGINKVIMNFKYISVYILRIAVPLFIISYCFQIYNFSSSLNMDLIWYENLMVIFGVGPYFNPVVFLLWVLGITTIASASLLSINTEEPVSLKEFFGLSMKLIFPIGLLFFVFISVVHTFPVGALLLVIPIVPFAMYIPSAILFSNQKSYFNKLSKGVQIGSSLWGSSLGLLGMCVGISILALMGIVGFSFESAYEILPGLGDMINMILEPIVDYMFDEPQLIYTSLLGFFMILAIGFILPIFFVSFSYQYFSSVEKEEAIGLEEDFEKFGTRSRMYEKKYDFDE
ncbi:MAG: stage II sporulation protein M [Crocinitomicaceae bacterium]|nr:stage II sporulation protein M [Crocinitomicaceae bacterium]